MSLDDEKEPSPGSLRIHQQINNSQAARDGSEIAQVLFIGRGLLGFQWKTKCEQMYVTIPDAKIVIQDLALKTHSTEFNKIYYAYTEHRIRHRTWRQWKETKATTREVSEDLLITRCTDM